MNTLESAEVVAERQLINRVLASRHFNKAPLLSAFLIYVCDRSLNEGKIRIAEQEIGIDVFHREEDYDPREDNIVRNYARQLRKRLDEYYASEGHDEAIRITIPKGGYVPVFTKNSSAQVLHTIAPFAPQAMHDVIAPVPLKNSPAICQQKTLAKRLWERWMWLAITSVTLLLIAVVVRHLRKITFTDPKAAHPLWSRVFQPNLPTTWISPDSGLVLLTVGTQKEASLEEYLRHDFSHQLQGLSPEEAMRYLTMADRRYTSFVDVQMIHRFDTETVADKSKFKIRFARDLHLNDLKEGNIILLGSHFSNPWVELYEPKMNFVGIIDFQNRGFRFANRHPKPSELPEYSISWNDFSRRVLGSVAFLPGLEGKNNVLIIEGSSLAGGEAVEDYLLNDTAFIPFLTSITRPDGSLPFFELLLESNNIDGTPGPYHIIASRIYN